MYTPHTICSVEHSIENTNFPDLYTLYDTTHLIKNIRNYWISEKTRTLEFLEPYTNEKINTKWTDIVHIYKAVESNMVRQITIDYQTLYPNNFERQKVQLVMNILSEKTIACLRRH